MSEETELVGALQSIRAFGAGTILTQRIAGLEASLRDQPRDAACDVVAEQEVTESMLRAALLVKGLAGQIDVIVHAIGILVSLPHILEAGEVIETLSLGAGNTGRAHDLETDRRIAEFKFIDWKGGAESIRQNSLFVDLFNLASAKTEKRRVLYVVGKEIPLRFLKNRRALASVLSKNAAAADRFRALHGDEFPTVREYYATVKDRVELVDLRDAVPAFSSAATASALGLA